MSLEEQIEERLDHLLQNTPRLLALRRELKDLTNFASEYQEWYTQALKLVELLGPDRLEEFIGYYRIDPKRKAFLPGTYAIQDYINGIGASTDPISRLPAWDIHVVISLRVTNQSFILKSLKSRLSGVLADIQGHLLARIEDVELQGAEGLLSVNIRAAGVLAGVVLESHLQRVVSNHALKLRKRVPSIADLNETLKQAGVYDVVTWRRVQHMSDIRNLCAHKKGREPTREEIETLLSGTATITKTLF